MAATSELRAKLDGLAADLADVPDFVQVGQRAAMELARLMPRRTGRLIGSIRVLQRPNRATVVVGARYALALNYGARGKPGLGFVARTDVIMEVVVTEVLQRGFDTLANKHGLG